MNIDLFIEYISQFLNNQKCQRHPEKRAKVMKINSGINEVFVCSECMENDNR